MTPTELHDKHRGLLLKDLRIQLRARGLNPAGGREALLDRLVDAMIASHDDKLYAEGEARAQPAHGIGAPADQNAPPASAASNNYGRPGGQNVGNFLTERNSSRVLAAPGGTSQIVFGDDPAPPAAKACPVAKTVNIDAVGAPAPADAPANVQAQAAAAEAADGPHGGNNYHRPSGQNVGNFLTARNSSRVSAPPGGASQIIFG
ncbi:hypothetical protein WJX81_005208 [Elliptochloris bilobata]|uniref:SAP domain-containing protein n=1 Tax=Elliptochloris bilobata TaxID=381761 RepID=A0AAW1SC10_9CHLO